MCLCVCFWFYLSVCVWLMCLGYMCLFVFDLSVWVICVCLICLFVRKGRMCAACVEYNNRLIRISCLIYKLIQFVFMPPFISRELTNLFFLSYSSFSTASVCLLTHLSVCTRLSVCLLCRMVLLYVYLLDFLSVYYV